MKPWPPLIAIGLAVGLGGCSASGPAALASDFPVLELSASFNVQFPMSEGDVLAVFTNREDNTQLIGEIRDQGSNTREADDIRGTVRFRDAQLPNAFVLVVAAPPERAGIDLSEMADRRIFALARCDENDHIKVYRPQLSDSFIDALPEGIRWDAEVRMLRMQNDSDLVGTLSAIISDGQYIEDYTDELPFPILCNDLFANGALE